MPGTRCSCDWQRELFVGDAAQPRRVLAVEGNEPAWRKVMSEPPHSYCDLTIEALLRRAPASTFPGVLE